MNLPTFTPATRARLMLAMNDALNVQDDDTTSQESAFVNAVTHSESPGLTLMLAEAIEDAIDRHISADVQHVIVDPSALYSAGYDSHTVCTALKLSGLVESRVSGSGVVWSTAKNPKPTLPTITVSGDILQDWTKIE